MDGIINVLKPPGMTSHDVVYFVRKITGAKKCGHTGTLDPGATGVLPVCLGKATRLARFVTEGNKSYRAEMTLGVSTTTQDAFGDIVELKDAFQIYPEQIDNLLPSFIGDIKQTPPMASAIKINGQRLYDLARQGQSIDVPTRIVTIFDLRVVQSNNWGTAHPRILFDVTCSKGTYVRTLCADIGRALGCGAYMSFLLRTRVAGFSIDHAYTLEDLTDLAGAGQISLAVVPMVQAVNHLPLVEINPTAQRAVCSGATLYPAGVKRISGPIKEDAMVRVQSGQNLLGIYRAVQDMDTGTKRIIFKPEVVLGE
ncbi:tRNA pseudouridine synthase B [Desulfotomaculum nigrificans CO-1-SRB]|uniref:tRNA pseudouridine synthase B n=1 Tax=Desulfotomaculum nigrificans (strain DSM 14880 / VKM B-2319 / CO-1-SRB) TaxID=868595 RepID=F6B626_DESCC|nr:tRNA pseudouridine(55) synthase TruB [Desulfotomaculum nigrificans]AEF94345.1 tRNA pseudouridine synthase B [Desulfotomaculum nigrificans CO-1-SRB]